MPRIANGDIEIDQLAAEQLVPHGAADHPGVLTYENLSRRLKHR